MVGSAQKREEIRSHAVAQIQLLREGEVRQRVLLSDGPVHIGRAPNNDLILPEQLISNHHLVLWWKEGQVWGRDLSSTNGTTLNRDGVHGRFVVPDGGVITLAGSVDLRVSYDGEAATLGRGYGLLVHNLDSGAAVPLACTAGFRIGSAPDADLRLEGGPEVAATITVEEGGPVRVDTGEASFPAPLGQPFRLAGTRLCVERCAVSPDDTLLPRRFHSLSYRLEITLNRNPAPSARLSDARSGRSLEITSENRVVLLYLLAQRRRDEADRPGEERGWCPDSEVIRGVWGASGERLHANTLHMLLYRLRQELTAAGFDPGIIEKRRRHIRLNIDDIEIR